MTMPVSGPGPYSQRTDQQPVREVTGLPYGDGQALVEQQQSAPMAQAPAPSPIPLSAPSNRPEQPVTAGADRGPGPDSRILSMRPKPTGTPLTEALSKAAATDPSGVLAALLMEAMKRGL